MGFSKVDRLIPSTRYTARYLAQTQQVEAFLSGLPKIVFEFIAIGGILIVLAMNEKLFENTEKALLIISTVGMLLIRLTPIPGRFGVLIGQIQSATPLITDQSFENSVFSIAGIPSCSRRIVEESHTLILVFK